MVAFKGTVAGHCLSVALGVPGFYYFVLFLNPGKKESALPFIAF